MDGWEEKVLSLTFYAIDSILSPAEKSTDTCWCKEISLVLHVVIDTTGGINQK